MRDSFLHLFLVYKKKCAYALSCSFVGLLLITNPACADSILDLFMSRSDEQRIGGEEHPKVLKSFGGEYEHDVLTPYVQSLGQFLVQTSETPDAKFTFTILNTPLVNAFALPGGYVYVTRGILSLASNEAELAGVLAHEIAHVTARHSAARATNTGIAQLGLLALDLIGGSAMASKVGEIGALALIQSYSREDEFEADKLGVKYLSRAGFDPRGMSTFLQKLQAHSSYESARLGVARDKGLDFFATHPRTLERVDRAIELAGGQETKNPIVAEELYLKKINGMLYGDALEQGMDMGDVFVHPILGFEFSVPTNFVLLNGTDMVVGRSNDGAIFQFDVDKNHQKDIYYYFTKRWLKGESLTKIREIKIDGLRSVVARLVSGSQNDGELWACAIEFDRDSIYRFILSVPKNLSQMRRRNVLAIPTSFRQLPKELAEIIKPSRLEIHEVSEGEISEVLAMNMRVVDSQLERFLIMNGLRHGQKLDAGTLVKLVGD